jgi:hypothetical protein
MSKIIKITSDYKSAKKYLSTVDNVVEKLEAIEDDLQGLVVNLATAGKWKEWSDKIPDGETFEFTEEMLKDTGDSNVDSIAGLLDELIRVKKKIKNGK